MRHVKDKRDLIYYYYNTRQYLIYKPKYDAFRNQTHTSQFVLCMGINLKMGHFSENSL